MKKFKVNKSSCIGCGACTGIAADVFTFGDDGLADATGEVTEANVADCEAAKDGCPVGAIEEE